MEETPKKIRNIIESTEAIKNRNKSSQLTQQQADKMREEIVEKEKLLLKLLNFDLKVEHPYKSVMNYISNLKKDDQYKDKVKELAQAAWNFVNDSFQTILCLQYPPQKIAAACIHLSAKCIKIELPKDWEKNEIFRTTPEENDKIGGCIYTLYGQNQQAAGSSSNQPTTGDISLPSSSTNASPSQGKKRLPFAPVESSSTSSGSASTTATTSVNETDVMDTSSTSDKGNSIQEESKEEGSKFEFSGDGGEEDGERAPMHVDRYDEETSVAASSSSINNEPTEDENKKP